MKKSYFIHKVVSMPYDYLGFLIFLNPGFRIIKSLKHLDIRNLKGIIYTGDFSFDLVDKLKSITDNWIIYNSSGGDICLNTVSDFIKVFFPTQYSKIFPSSGEIAQYKKSHKGESFPRYIYADMDLYTLMNYSKYYIFKEAPLPYLVSDISSIYPLFEAVSGLPHDLDIVYFELVSKIPINVLISSFLTFLYKVQSKTTPTDSSNYAELIIYSNRKYGSFIKDAIRAFITSNELPEIAFYKLLVSLNQRKLVYE